MWGVIIVLLLVLWAAFPAYVYRRRLFRWWNAEVANRNLAPHERWPEILHWQEGDVFDLRGAYCGMFVLKSITSEGSVFGYEGVGQGGRIEKWGVASLIGHNRSFRERSLRRELQTTSDEYMELIRQFNIAFKELQERDKRNGIAA